MVLLPPVFNLFRKRIPLRRVVYKLYILGGGPRGTKA